MITLFLVTAQIIVSDFYYRLLHTSKYMYEIIMNLEISILYFNFFVINELTYLFIYYFSKFWLAYLYVLFTIPFNIFRHVVLLVKNWDLNYYRSIFFFLNISFFKKSMPSNSKIKNSPICCFLNSNLFYILQVMFKFFWT